jgi:drug/metabolite transporter (DMT)-like permease
MILSALAFKNYKISTLIGSGALLLWAVEPLLVSELINVPAFEALTIVFISCFLLTAIRITMLRRWKIILRQNVFVWIFGVITICGSDLCYLLGSKLAPIAHIDLIDYLWPCLIVVWISFLPNEKFRTYSILGTILGFIGIFQLCFSNEMLHNMQASRLLGYGIAMFGICLWGGYSIFSKYHKNVPNDMMGIYCGVGALVCLGIHLHLETTVVPECNEVGMAVVLGLAGPGLAYQLWDHGVKHGNVGLLSTGCYLARIAALILLVYFGKEPFSKELVIAGVLAFLGIFIGHLDNCKLFKTNKKTIEVDCQPTP